MYLHWSPKLAVGLFVTFGLLITVFWTVGIDASSALKAHTTMWIVANYAGLVIWIYVWIGDQTRMRGKTVWPWLIPLVLAPLPTLAIFLVHTLRQAK